MNRTQTALVALTVLAAASGVIAAETGLLNWTPPSQYTDGSLLAQADIAATNLRCSAIIVDGVRTGCSLAQQTVAAPTTSYAWDFSFNPRGGQICFQAQTVMVSGSVSEWSAEQCKTISGKRPNPPILVIK
jgi:hypothetical protein